MRRTNLRELAARPERHEHHLTVVARVGDAQLEIATASEPLYFAHINVSDEYAIALRTGDELVDGLPLRTFITDPRTAEDVARYNHRAGDLVLHPLGLSHWPGRLRPPYDPTPIPDAMRRCGLSLVLCACKPTVTAERPLGVTAGREADAKTYLGTPPLALRDAYREEPRTLARVGTARLDLAVSPSRIDAPRGAYVVVLSHDGGAWHACDLIHVPAESTLDATGIERALVFHGDAPAASPPESWERVPGAAFSPFDEAQRLPLPVMTHGITASAVDAERVSIAVGRSSAAIPRHWLTRMLFAIGLHHPSLAYVETYGGFFYDDRGDRVVVGIHGTDGVFLSRKDALDAVETLYRSVAPDGYLQR